MVYPVQISSALFLLIDPRTAAAALTDCDTKIARLSGQYDLFDHFSFAEPHRTLDDILHLAHIAGRGIINYPTSGSSDSARALGTASRERAV